MPPACATEALEPTIWLRVTPMGIDELDDPQRAAIPSTAIYIFEIFTSPGGLCILLIIYLLDISFGLPSPSNGTPGADKLFEIRFIELIPLTPIAETRNSHRSRLMLGLLFVLLVLGGVSLFLIPAWIIQPFKYQSPVGLSLALSLRQVAPWGTLIAGALSFFLTWKVWGRVGRWKKVLLSLGLCLATVAAVMARVDYFEWMFHPVSAPGFQPAEDSKLASSEMVMAVHFGDDARAYPILAMAYHHVVNDVVQGIPIVVTY